MKLYITKYLRSIFSKTNLTAVKNLGTKIQFPLAFSYRLEFETDSYTPEMTNNRIPKEDILVFFLNLYSYTDKLALLWLTFCGAFFPFVLLLRVLVEIWKRSSIYMSLLLFPLLFPFTDLLSSYIIVTGMKFIKKNINAYINHRQAGFRQLGVRWKVSDDEWLTLELVLDYKHSMETKKDFQQESTQLLPKSRPLIQDYISDLEGPAQGLRQSFA